MRAMTSPTLSHLDPLYLKMIDELRDRLVRLFRAPQGSFAFLVSGTGTSVMETAVANLVADGTRVLVIVTGYFGDRLAQICARYGATVTRLEVEWGRACDPDRLRSALGSSRADIVAMVHAETSTGVLNPVAQLAAVAREHDALVVVDAVTSFCGQPLDVGEWGIDVCFSCSQKCLGAPAGMAPIVFTARALDRRVACRSFYFDLQLLEDFWLRRKYHHTMSSVLVYACAEALCAVEEEGLDARWSRHAANHALLVDQLTTRGLTLLPPAGERLWTLNAIRVPAGVDDGRVRQHLLNEFNVEIGAGLGPLAGQIWRVGLMGASSSPQLVLLLAGALDSAMQRQGRSIRA
jgi:alanine-glyoxylate transaminase/serine-glyoxylate transaminase/serine-pyruvate transaminase